MHSSLRTDVVSPDDDLHMRQIAKTNHKEKKSILALHCDIFIQQMFHLSEKVYSLKDEDLQMRLTSPPPPIPPHLEFL